MPEDARGHAEWMSVLDSKRERERERERGGGGGRERERGVERARDRQRATRAENFRRRASTSRGLQPRRTDAARKTRKSRHHTAICGPCPPPGVGVVCGIVPSRASKLTLS